MDSTKKIKLLDFKLTKSIWNLFFGLFKSKFNWNWINFAEHREYIFWDSVKNIDWKASSKSEKIFVKKFEEEKEIDVLFLIDTNSSMLFSSWNKSKLDILEEVFYTLSFSAYKNLNNFWVLFFWGENSDFLPYKKDFWNILKTIEALENIKISDKIIENRLENIFSFLAKHKTKNKLIFVLSDAVLEEENKDLKILWIANQIIFINIFDYLENKLDKIPENLDLSYNKDFLNISLKSKKIEEFNELRAKKLEKFSHILQKNNIWYVYLDTKKDVFKEMVSYFNKI